jgi:hypothetical protein
VRAVCLVVAVFLAACGAGPVKPEWEMSAAEALHSFQRHYFAGDARLAEAEFRRARAELSRTGRADLLARAELLRCAVRAASLEFDACPGFEALRDAAGPEELAYSEYLAGRARRAATPEDALSRLVAAAVQLRSGAISPSQIASAVDTASAQGWRRPLLAWLAVQAKRAEDAGDTDTAERIRRRMELVSG